MAQCYFHAPLQTITSKVTSGMVCFDTWSHIDQDTPVPIQAHFTLESTVLLLETVLANQNKSLKIWHFDECKTSIATTSVP